jgi:hypothetical protein
LVMRVFVGRPVFVTVALPAHTFEQYRRGHER